MSAKQPSPNSPRNSTERELPPPTGSAFIVVCDDNQGVCAPMAWDDDCEGAICCQIGKSKIALFATRKAARKAIDISSKLAALHLAQGKPVNTDFVGECRKNLKVIGCKPNVKAHLQVGGGKA